MPIDRHRQRVGTLPSRPAIKPIKSRPETKGKSDFIPYPTNKVVGIIDDVADARAALHDLQEAGFTARQIRVLTGEEGAHRIDPRGDQHGLFAHMLRSIQKKLGDYEIPHATRHEEEMLAGHFGFGVTVRRKKDRDKALQVLKSHRGHFINFYGPLIMEILKR